jgi:hypothetical protein
MVTSHAAHHHAVVVRSKTFSTIIYAYMTESNDAVHISMRPYETIAHCKITFCTCILDTLVLTSKDIFRGEVHFTSSQRERHFICARAAQVKWVVWVREHNCCSVYQTRYQTRE